MWILELILMTSLEYHGCFFKDLLICLKGLVTGVGDGIRALPFAGLLLKWRQWRSRAWSGGIQELRTLTGSPILIARAQKLWPSSTVFPGTLAGTWMWNVAAKIKYGQLMVCWHFKLWHNSLYYSAATPLGCVNNLKNLLIWMVELQTQRKISTCFIS